MENGNKHEINRYSFLFDRKAKDLFAKLDYLLRSGVHIQREYPLPAELFRFIQSNFESLKDYYNDFFKVTLCEEGAEFNRYFYIDFEEGGKSNIFSNFREQLKTEYLIIGILFFKLYKIDGNIEIDSISSFTTTLFTEYEEEMLALRKLIANTTTSKNSDFNDRKVEEVIHKAFSKFQELGWIAWKNNNNKDSFDYMPSFERLRLLYLPQILGIDNLIKDLNNDR